MRAPNRRGHLCASLTPTRGHTAGAQCALFQKLGKATHGKRRQKGPTRASTSRACTNELCTGITRSTKAKRVRATNYPHANFKQSEHGQAGVTGVTGLALQPCTQSRGERAMHHQVCQSQSDSNTQAGVNSSVLGFGVRRTCYTRLRHDQIGQVRRHRTKRRAT